MSAAFTTRPTQRLDECCLDNPDLPRAEMSTACTIRTYPKTGWVLPRQSGPTQGWDECCLHNPDLPKNWSAASTIRTYPGLRWVLCLHIRTYPWLRWVLPRQSGVGDSGPTQDWDECCLDNPDLPRAEVSAASTIRTYPGLRWVRPPCRQASCQTGWRAVPRMVPPAGLFLRGKKLLTIFATHKIVHVHCNVHIDNSWGPTNALRVDTVRWIISRLDSMKGKKVNTVIWNNVDKIKHKPMRSE